MENWHRKKYDELDALLRGHFTRQEHKQQRADSSLRVLQGENDSLRQYVVYLTAELDHCREACRTLEKDAAEEQLREQALAVRQHQLMRCTENDLLQRREELDRTEREVQQRLSDVVAREKQVNDLWQQYEERKSTLDAALSLSQKQVESDLHRAQLVRERAEATSREAHAALESERSALSATQTSLRLTLARSQLLDEEAQTRTAVERRQVDEQRQLVAHHCGRVAALFTDHAAHNANALKELRTQRELVALRDRELTVKYQRERDALEELAERQAINQEDFQLECTAILSQVKGLVTDLTPCAVNSPGLLEQLASLQQAVDALYRKHVPASQE